MTSGSIAGLSDVAAENARTVAAVASARDGDAGALIVLMVGLTESGLRQLGNPNDATAAGLVDQGIGFDHDSIGIFQQRPSWGTAQQRMDPVSSSGLLLDQIEAIPGWRGELPWVVAQDVQVSAFDGIARPANGFIAEVGGNYRAQFAEATRLLDVIDRDARLLRCDGAGGSGVGAPPPGPANAYGLPDSFAIPASVSPAGQVAVRSALSALGRPYIFGADGPNSFDGSGLTAWAWAHAGVPLPHYTVSQGQSGSPTDVAHLEAGDLVLIPGSDGTITNPQHVGMFIGEGLVVEAPQTGDVVKVVTYSSFVSAGLGGLRHIG